MSVHNTKKDNSGRWFVQYRKIRKIQREYFGRGQNAEKEAVERDTQLAVMRRLGRSRVETSPTFSALAEGYLAARIASMEKTTTSVLKYKLKAFLLPELGGLESMKITKDRIDKYVYKRLSQGRQASTIHREITDIQAILNWAARDRQLISHNPLAGYKKPRPDSLIVAPPTLAEMAAINKHAAGHLKRLLKLIFYTGARPGRETLNLKWESVNWTHNTIRIISAKKHGLKYRDVPISQDFRTELEVWQEEDKRRLKAVRLKAEGKPVTRDQEPETPPQKVADTHIVHYRGAPIKSIQTSWKHALQKAEIQRPIRPYSYRHAFVSMMLDAGADLKSVSEIVGHSNPTLTLRVYQHTNKAMHRAAIDKIPAINW